MENFTEIFNEVNDMNNIDIFAQFEKLQSLWDYAKTLIDSEPERAVRILTMLSLKARALPETWREIAKDIFRDTNNLINKIGGSDYVSFLLLADLFRLENDHLAEANQYRWAAEAIGRNGLKVMTTTYSATSDEEERIRYLRLAATKFQTGGDADQASQCYVDAMKLERDRGTGSKKLWLWIGWILWGWGERPLHVVASASAIIAFYAIGYLICGIKPIADSRWDLILDSIYFSIITFATVGYGDITPGSSWSKLLAASEGLMGIFFTGLFLVTFVKRSTR
jgi:Ion channel